MSGTGKNFVGVALNEFLNEFNRTVEEFEPIVLIARDSYEAVAEREVII